MSYEVSHDVSYEPVIGLEVHAQLSTQTKLFCGCPVEFGKSPNANTCEVCLGMPGVLPVLNEQAVALAVRAALGLGCEVNRCSQWSRKNYFYPDLPKGYQISQYDRPIATGGELRVEVNGAAKVIGITRIHMEEDAGKNVHDDLAAGQRSYVDFNRGGTPLIEIVSEPDIRSAAEAAAYMKALRQILRYLDVCDGNMERGNLRCDANVSIRPAGSTTFGTRTEIKNLNSFRFVQQAIEFEIFRQGQVIHGGDEVTQETRLWDSDAKVTRSMRSKEEAHDYRYFPDPDLPDLDLGGSAVAKARTELPELPAAKRARYVKEFGLSDYDATVLTEEAEVAGFFEAALGHHANPKAIANWMNNELASEIKDREIAEQLLGPQELAELVALIDDNTISGKIAKEILPELIAKGGSPKAIVKARGLEQVTDTSSIEPIVERVLAENPKSVATYKAGKANVLGFFVGQVMKATGGKANPKVVNELLRKKMQ